MSSIWAAAEGLLLPVVPYQGHKQWFSEPSHVDFMPVKMKSSVLQPLPKEKE